MKDKMQEQVDSAIAKANERLQQKQREFDEWRKVNKKPGKSEKQTQTIIQAEYFDRPPQVRQSPRG